LATTLTVQKRISKLAKVAELGNLFETMVIILIQYQ
jgi:hypothetical protein